ncbi:UvrD-helicase domain-containing protein [Acidicapsa acidisoli]|uniref:UvrD-helicase domain-containing protein n=1 Tax=Acidicapsa acidisoli TaxID=1615681 RepID=UPI0021E07E24|nr:UvrD-helicase domain-containing protein [Acidicapsa acidisoli]
MPERVEIVQARPAIAPPDQAERSRALDPARSFLVQAPAGSGKTYLLTQRFLRLLAQADKPDEIVAITFTNAAAAEMRHRILEALEKAESAETVDGDPESLPALATRALARAKQLGWQILDQPHQLRVTTIDAFCRGMALQSPLSWGLLSGLGGRLDPVNNPNDLYRRAATRTIELLNAEESPTRQSVEELLRWRDNHWKDVEDLLVQMLGQRNRWFQGFVFDREVDWEELRERLEAPFCRAAHGRLETLGRLLDRHPGSREFALRLARIACENPGKLSPLGLAERAELLTVFVGEDGVVEPIVLEDAAAAYCDLANFLLTAKGEWRKKGGLTVNHGFPSGTQGKAAKEQFAELVASLAEEPGLQAALAAFQEPMPLRYTDAEWELIRHCFAVLRFAAGQLQVVFAETGSVDFTEVAQIALRILAPENGFPSDFAMRQADGIRHLLIDEFQDTSRNQHQLLARLIAAWPEREGRSCFCVGDPMQSIYGFREAEVELFERLKTHGLETASGISNELFRFDFVPLRANFRTVPSLVNDLNGHFERVFAENDGSGVRFSAAEAARQSPSVAKSELHLAFTMNGKADEAGFADAAAELTRENQLGEIVALIGSKLEVANQRKNIPGSEKYRIAVLGKTRPSLNRIAEALSKAKISFRAIDLVLLRDRPEVLDALSLARALLNPTDRTAWLGVLRAPWCGLSLAELHLVTSADDAVICATPVPKLLASRLPMLFEQGLLSAHGFQATSRVAHVLKSAAENRSTSSTAALGTWLASVWKALGGGDTVDAVQGANLRLLWAALDKLLEGELDLLGGGLNSALNELYALPDPDASSDFGVQLMTIHKSKGLEFEVILVPDLEAEGKKSEKTMISWLERGLADAGGDGDQLTEFLIAPIQAKGAEIGVAKRWVDRVKRKREEQELRRLLYVAATRAREELHLFARPRFRMSRSSEEPELASPTGMLKTAWPAIGEETQAQFDAWLAQRSAAQEQVTPAPLELATLAAEASNLLQMPVTGLAAASRPTMLRRLPEGYQPPELANFGTSSSRASQGSNREESREALYARTEGGLRSRLLGTAIHAFLEELSILRRSMSPSEAASAVADALPAVTAQVRSHGLTRDAAERLAGEALAVAQQASTDPTGSWILAPHPQGDAEARWTGLVGPDAAGGRGRQWNLRPDRVFFAEAPPSLESVADSVPANEPIWWIIDYKSAGADGIDLVDDAAKQVFLRAQREQYKDQLAAYAQVLRSLHEAKGEQTTPIRTGIYYPRLQLLDVWNA